MPGDLDDFPTQQVISDQATSMDATRYSAPENHPTPAVFYLEFLRSPKMSTALAPHFGAKRLVVLDVGCGSDGRLGVLLQNHLRL